MEKHNFLDHKFRASSFGNLMAGAKELSEAQLNTIEVYQAKLVEKKKLTDKQQELYDKLVNKEDELTPKEKQIVEDFENKMSEVVGLTPNQQEALDDLLKKRDTVELSSGAKTYCRKLRREIKFNRRKELKSKYLEKGIHYEEQAITFLSHYHDDIFTNNKERRSDEYFQGECDVEEGFDTKVSWELDTLPDHESAIDTIYEFQNRIYARLWNREEWTTSSIVMNMTDDEMRKTLYGEAWKWTDNEIPDWRKIEIIKHYIYDEENFIRLCKLNDCIPDLKEYESQLKTDVVDTELRKACEMFLGFVEIPEHERIVEKTVKRDLDIEKKMIQIVLLARQYMQEIEDEMEEKRLSRINN